MTAEDEAAVFNMFGRRRVTTAKWTPEILRGVF